VYSQKYIPNNLSPSQEEFFKQADDCFGYSSNFNQTFSVCFCSACHGKYKHIKKVKSNTTDIKKLNTTNTKQLKSSLYNNSSNCDSELKFKLFIKNKNGNILSGRDLNSKKSNKPKSKALCISNDNNADKDEMDKADQITKLRQKWECKICNKICYIKKNTMINTPPVYPIFNISYGRIVQPQFPSQSTDSNNILPYGMSYAPQPQIIYYPALVYSANSYSLSGSPNINNSFTLAIHSSKTVHKFFLELEVINNESGSYTQFERAFENKKISLDTIKELSESDLIELEVNKIG
ncbi:15854_t:CDS:2, partial [Gigaspora margarita]